MKTSVDLQSPTFEPAQDAGLEPSASASTLEPDYELETNAGMIGDSMTFSVVFALLVIGVLVFTQFFRHHPE